MTEITFAGVGEGSLSMTENPFFLGSVVSKHGTGPRKAEGPFPWPQWMAKGVRTDAELEREAGR